MRGLPPPFRLRLGQEPESPPTRAPDQATPRGWVSSQGNAADRKQIDLHYRRQIGLGSPSTAGATMVRAKARTGKSALLLSHFGKFGLLERRLPNNQ
jgi:hypothetical protein